MDNLPSVINLFREYRQETGIHPAIMEIDRRLYAQLAWVCPDQIKTIDGIDYYDGAKIVITDDPIVRLEAEH